MRDYFDKWVDFYTRTTFYKMSSADDSCWMNTVLTDCLIGHLFCIWCGDKQILTHACFCFRLNWIVLPLSSDFSSDVRSTCLSLPFLWPSPHLTHLSSLNFKVTSYTNRLNSSERITCHPPHTSELTASPTTTPSESDRTEQDTRCLSKPAWQNQINEMLGLLCNCGKTNKTESKVDFNLISVFF